VDRESAEQDSGERYRDDRCRRRRLLQVPDQEQ